VASTRYRPPTCRYRKRMPDILGHKSAVLTVYGAPCAPYRVIRGAETSGAKQISSKGELKARKFSARGLVLPGLSRRRMDRLLWAPGFARILGELIDASRKNQLLWAPAVEESQSRRRPADCEAGLRAHLRHQVFPLGLIDNTGQPARATTLAVTLPSMICSIPVRPWVDMTIRSTACSSAFATILL
jgi:hypothetical protein